MRRLVRTSFTASVVTTFALAGAGCGGKSDTSSVPTHENPPRNPGPQPEADAPVTWIISQAGDGQCHAYAQGDVDERTVYCPEGVNAETGATLWQTGDACTYQLDGADPMGDAASTPCPDPK